MGRKSVNLTTSVSADCPFGPGVCRGNQTVEVDTGNIDSTVDLGINTPPKDRLNLNVRLLCTPLITDGYTFLFDKNNLSIMTNQTGYLGRQLVSTALSAIAASTDTMPQHLPSYDNVGLTTFGYGPSKHWDYTFVYSNLTTIPYVGADTPGPRVGYVPRRLQSSARIPLE